VFQKVVPMQAVAYPVNLPSFCFMLQVKNYKPSLNSHDTIFVPRFMNNGHVLLKLCL